jgi:hypothetical protein
MDTPEKRALIDEATTRFQTLLDERGRQSAVTVSSFRSPYYLPSQGLCAHVSLYDNSTYQGPSGDFVVVPSAALMDPSALWRALEAKLVALEARGVAALGDPLADTLGFAELAPSEELFADPLQEARRQGSLDKMLSRFDAVSAQFRAHYGLRLPRWMAVLAAFVDSASELERSGLESIGRGPGGALGYFEDGGLERATIDGLDPRLEMRFRCDPPEMVSFLWGDSDGLHYGMFFDDPAELPGAIVYNWARDSAETWAAEQTTGLSLLAARVRERFTDQYREEEPGVAEWALRAALRWFAEADRRAVDEDGIVRYRGVKREAMLGAVSAALPKSAGDPRLSREKVEARQVEYRKKRTPKIVREWIAEARDELAKARPAFAYTLGRELHWLDSDLYRAVSEELLVAAYEALGRRALADVLRVHVANRDLPMVTVFQRS